MTRVVLISLDGFVHTALSPFLTPRLWELANAGGFAPQGGRSSLPSVTYPSHATLLTGTEPRRHGIRTGLAGKEIPGKIPGWAGMTEVQTTTLFDACRSAGLPSAAICGDQRLVGILRSRVADSCWPPDSAVPPGVPVDAFGYVTNAATHERVLPAVAGESTFVFAHYNETDTFGHLFGPNADETRGCCAATDELVGEVLDLLASDWTTTVIFVVSDHGMNLLPETEPTDLRTVHPGVLDSVDEAGCALVQLRQGFDASAVALDLALLPEVESVAQVDRDVLQVLARSGTIFGRGTAKAVMAGHGGLETQATLAIVGGGDPAVASLAEAFCTSSPALIDIAPTVAQLLDVDLGAVDGRTLIS